MDSSAGGAVSSVLKYSNWLVTAVLFFVGARVLFVISRVRLSSGSLSTETVAVSVAQAIIALLFILAAVGTIRWKAWGRSLGIVVCGWNAFGTIFLTRLGPKHRIAGLSFCAALLLLIIWFYLPRVKSQFVRGESQSATA
jgi:hypothetical protein